MKSLWTGAVAVGVLLAGCTAATNGGSQITLKPLSSAAALRTLSVHIAGPSDLAQSGKILNDAGAAILTDAGAGVIAAGGGNVIAAGGGNVIAAGGGNLLGAGAPRFRVSATDTATTTTATAVSTASFTNVGKAHVQVFSLDGKKVGQHVVAGEDGTAKIKAKDGKPLLAVAMFKVGDRTYRMAAMLAPGKTDMPVEIDPINTMVETRIRQIIGSKDTVSAMTFTKLKRVWSICNSANITLASDDLDASKTPEQILERLTAVWKEAIDAKVTTQADKDELKGFMAEMTAAVAAK